MAKPDGSVVINTLVDTKGFGKGVTNMKSQFSSMTGAVGKLGAAIGVAFSVKALVDFAKQSIELGSNLQEVQNVVDVTFPTMSAKIDDFAKSAAASAGLSETMAKKYAGTFGAMSKSFGFAEKDAFDMSTSLTQLAGDVASFYNLTQDEAYTKLKSVFTGETETLKDLGVVMTQTALDSYAMAKGYGKTTNAMTEQEKVALRYQFVMDQLSGASGDFVRTSDGWANQTRVLKLNVESFMATVGQGLINLLTPAIKLVNVFLSKAQVLAASFKSWTDAIVGTGGGAAESIGDASSNMSGLTESAQDANKAAKALKKNFSGLDEIKTFDSGSSAAVGEDVLGGVEAIVPSIDTSGASKATDAVGGVADAIIASFQKVLTYLQPITDDLASMFTTLATSTVSWAQGLDFSSVLSSLDGVYQAILPLVTIITDSLAWAWEAVLLPMSGWAFNEAAPTILNLFSEALSSVGMMLTPVVDGIKEMWNWLSPVFSWIGDVAIGIIERFRELFAKLGGVFEEKGGKIKELIAGIGEAVTAVWKLIKPVLDKIVEHAFKVFDIVGDVIGGWIAYLIDLFHGLIEFFVGVFTGDWSRAWDGIKGVVQGVKDWLSTIWESISRLFSNWLDNVKFGFRLFKDSVVAIFSKIGTALKKPINAIIGFINKLISGVCSGINAMIGAFNKLHFDIPDWIPGIGGKSFGFNIKTITPPQIPKLATGAVIPPNAPFYAMLGDQKHGTNIEAPLDTIKQALIEAMAERGGAGGNTYNVTATARGRVLFDLVLSEGRSELVRTGKNPFDLVKA